MAEIRKALISDAEKIKELMIKALESDPYAFNVDADEYSIRPDSWWHVYLSPYFDDVKGFLYLLIDNENLVGMCGCIYGFTRRTRHNADIVWYFVSGDYRGKGYSMKLVKETLNRIETNGVTTKVSLNVNATQEKAIGIYKSLGFTQCAKLKNELRINGKYVDKLSFEKIYD